ncbi:14654_t:CDS:1, partial [Gigaspora margarita]
IPVPTLESAYETNLHYANSKSSTINSLDSNLYVQQIPQVSSLRIPFCALNSNGLKKNTSKLSNNILQKYKLQMIIHRNK